MTTIPYLLLGAAVLWFVSATVAYQIRLRRRRGLSREEFIAAFPSGGEGLEKTAAAVYGYYSSLAVRRRYAVSPEDGYEKVLRAGPEEIRDDAAELLKELRLKMPSEAEQAQDLSTITTIRGMVSWLHWASQHQPADWNSGTRR